MSIYAYIGAGNEPGGGYGGDESLTIVNVTNPAAPSFVARVAHSIPTYLRGVIGVAVKGSYAYALDQMFGYLTVLDISDPSSPSYVTNLNTGYADAIMIQGNHAFIVGAVASGSEGIAAIDISDPTSIGLADSLADGGDSSNYLAIYVKGSYAYVAAHQYLFIFDISDPTNISLAGSVKDVTQLGSADGIIVDGDYAYVCAGEGPDYFTIVNISTPASPSITGSISGSGSPNYLDSPYGLAKKGNYVFVCSFGEWRFTVIDVTNPASPVYLSSLDWSGDARRPKQVVIRGNYAHVTVSDGSSSNNGLLIVDITDPSNMSVVGSLIGSGSPNYLNLASPLVLYSRFSYPSDAIARVSSIRHIYQPGSFRMQVGLGDLGFDVDVAEATVRGALDTAKPVEEAPPEPVVTKPSAITPTPAPSPPPSTLPPPKPAELTEYAKSILETPAAKALQARIAGLKAGVGAVISPYAIEVLREKPEEAKLLTDIQRIQKAASATGITSYARQVLIKKAIELKQQLESLYRKG